MATKTNDCSDFPGPGDCSKISAPTKSMLINIMMDFDKKIASVPDSKTEMFFLSFLTHQISRNMDLFVQPPCKPK